jgi:hypothetical protein
MKYLGIDIEKNNHVASMMNDNGKIVLKHLPFLTQPMSGTPCLKLFKSIPQIRKKYK